MADHAIGADHLHRMNGGARRFGGAGGGRGGSGGLAFTRLARRGGRVLAGEGGDQVAAGDVRLLIALPGRATAQLGGRKPLFAGLGEIGLPAFFDRTRVGQPGGIELLDIGGVGAVEKGCRFENFVGSAVQFV